MTDQLLVVCHANVCRSPAIAALLDERWALTDEDPPHVYSRGTDVQRERFLCATIFEDLVPADDIEAMIRRHKPTQLTEEDLDRAGLVITAGLAERASTVRFHPSARAKTFTLREAATLAEGLAERRERSGGWSALEEIVDEMDASRGTQGLLAPIVIRERWRPWHTLTIEAADIPDAHSSTAVDHGVLRPLITEGVERLSAALTRLGWPA